MWLCGYLTPILVLSQLWDKTGIAYMTFFNVLKYIAEWILKCTKSTSQKRISRH